MEINYIRSEARSEYTIANNLIILCNNYIIQHVVVYNLLCTYYDIYIIILILLLCICIYVQCMTMILLYV